MDAFEAVWARLGDADDLDSVMAAGWETFELILFVAHKYGGQKSDAFTTWMWAMGPASDGSIALEPGPSHRATGLAIDSSDLDGIEESDAFRVLASIAAELHAKLSAAALDPRPGRAYDVKACERAAEAASELHGLFALDE